LFSVSNGFHCQNALFNQPEQLCQIPLNQSTEKKYHTRRQYQTRKNYPGKKSFTVNPQNIFTLKNGIKKGKKFEKLNIGWGRKILWRYFF